MIGKALTLLLVVAVSDCAVYVDRPSYYNLPGHHYQYRYDPYDHNSWRYHNHGYYNKYRVRRNYEYRRYYRQKYGY